jgi:hypothetical protein
MNALSVTQTTKQKIVALLDELPPESLTAVEKFVEFLRQQAQEDQPVIAISEKKAPLYRYPTVPVPISALEGLTGIMPPVGGDALADTKALYDKV